MVNPPPPSPAGEPTPSAPAPSATIATGPADVSPARLDELEIRLSYFEDLLDTLNGLVARQSSQIEALGRELSRMRERLESGTASGSAGGSGAGADPASGFLDERPPHY